MRLLGESYAREEFRRHCGAKPVFLQAFYKEWTDYAQIIQQQLGKELSEEQKESMSLNQKQQLQRLKDEIERS
eukprot:CAMPEP_0177631140 /NCGR_PEP_ID=MMETSP0447-20121125/1587_1 /TAXON_ID=0 /ORGANISM="Stygamoeba regulata, Strain BSH-02190019" /LENGTH=72 /DNA_ID=CAMNT_0019132597 /DNA_START=51 /DNA_END=269 /DNA_ORIENTATION=-